MTSGTPPARKTRTVGCGPFGSAVHEPRHLAVDGDPVVDRGPRAAPAACAMAGMCSSRFVEPPNAACTTMALRIAASVRMSRVVRPRDHALARRAGRSARHVAPDRLPRRRERAVRHGEAQRLGDDLRRGRRAEELASAARRRARAASELRGLLERELAVREARADRLHVARVFAVRRRQRDAARARATRGRSRSRPAPSASPAGPCRRCHADDAAARRQRADQPPQHHRRVVPVRQAVHHARACPACGRRTGR